MQNFLRLFAVCCFGTVATQTPAFCADLPTATPKKLSVPAQFSPPITGELLVLDDKFDLSTLKTLGASVARKGQALEVIFGEGEKYPKVEFPVPQGGWNLSSHGGVSLEVKNTGAVPVQSGVRVDNEGEWKDEPWNTQLARLEPGETKVVNLVFGESNGGPGFPLQSDRVSALQFFLISPKPGAKVELRDLRAVGSPKPVASPYSKPEDALLPPAPAPSWIGTKPPVEGNWVQTLDENFDGPKINEKIWGLRTRKGWNDMIPGQTQRYSWDNLSFQDGVLKFKIEKRTGHQYDDPKEPTAPYTTSFINTYDRWTQAYGYFEARIKMPTAQGLWPAFWMMPDRGRGTTKYEWDRTDTGNGAMEIDIVEYLTAWGPGRYNVAHHWDGYGKNHKSWGTSHLYHRRTPDGFHHYGVLWEPGKLTYYVDGKIMAQYENERVASVPNFLILNVQTGGWAGNVVEDAKLPDFMQVDYVRAWQLKDRIK